MIADQNRLLRQEKTRDLLLRRFYDEGGHDSSIFVERENTIDDLAEQESIAKTEVEAAFDYLERKKLVEIVTNQHAQITTLGIDKVESAIAGKESQTLNPTNINNNEYIMGDKIATNISGQITNNGSMSIGKADAVVNTANESDRIDEILQAIKRVEEAIANTPSLAEDKKQEHIEVLTQLKEEVSKDKPNKTILQALQKGWMPTLKALPDISKAIVAIEPLISTLM